MAKGRVVLTIFLSFSKTWWYNDQVRLNLYTHFDCLQPLVKSSLLLTSNPSLLYLTSCPLYVFSFSHMPITPYAQNIVKCFLLKYMLIFTNKAGLNLRLLMDTQDNSPSGRGKRLKYIRKMADLSREDLSRLSGSGASTISYWESGKSNGLPPYEAEKLIQIINKVGVKCSLEWLVQGIGELPTLTQSTIASGESNDETLKNEEQFFHENHTNAVTLKIEDDAMLPFYNQGDLVGGIKCYEETILALVNQHCIIELETGIFVCRLLKISERKKHYHLFCTNLYTTIANSVYVDINIISAARVIWHRKELS